MPRKQWFLLGLIFILGLSLRLFQLGQVPLPNRDELAIGYNAYSIAANLKDEHGAGPLPLNFQSFGDYKLPGLIYAAASLVKVFGLSLLIVRLPNAVIGSLLILVVFFLVKELFPQNKPLPWWTDILVCFSFWHLHGSRSAYEPVVALTFSTASILFLLKARKKAKYLWLSLLFFSLGVATYNLPLLLLPLVFVLTVLVYRQDFFKKPKLLGAFCVLSAALSLTFLVGVGRVNQRKIGTTIVASSELQEQINQEIRFINQSHVPLPIARVLANKGYKYSFIFLKNYISAFDLRYLFFSGDDNPWHNLAFIDAGDINLVLLPFLFLGIGALLRSKQVQRSRRWLLGYLFLAPIPDAFTIDAPVTNRLLDFHLAAVLIISLGIVFSIKRLPKRLSKYWQLLVCGLLIISFGFFYIRYILVYPKNPDRYWEPGAVKMVGEVLKIEEEFDRIYITPRLGFGYIYFAFYNRFDPEHFQREAGWVNEELDRVIAFNKYVFDVLPSRNDLANLESMEKYFPEEVERVLVVEKGKPADQAGAFRIFLTDALDEPTWKAYTLSTDDLLTYFRQELERTDNRESMEAAIQYLEDKQL